MSLYSDIFQGINTPWEHFLFFTSYYLSYLKTIFDIKFKNKINTEKWLVIYHFQRPFLTGSFDLFVKNW